MCAHPDHPTASLSIEFGEVICDPCYRRLLVATESSRAAHAAAACGQSSQTIRAKRRSGEWPDHPR